MKGVDALIASVLIIMISVTAIFIALQLGRPSTEKAKEILLMQEAKNNLITIDNAVKSVLSEGEGSTRVLRFSISGGYYSIDITNSVLFSMESKSQIIGEGVSKIEDGINITGSSNMIYLNLSYINIQVTGRGDFGRGYHTITIRNDGYNTTAQKQMIYISLKPPAPTLITFTNKYNQTQTVVVFGTNTTSPNNLNVIDGLAYNITEAQVGNVNSTLFHATFEGWSTTTNCGGATTEGWNECRLGESTIYWRARTGTVSYNFSSTRYHEGNDIDTNNATRITKCLDLSSYSKAYVTFWYNKTLTNAANEKQFILVNRTGAGTFVSLWSSTTSASPWTYKEINITNYISAYTCIRYMAGAASASTERLLLDDFKIIGTKPTYRAEIENNATGVSLSGTIINISISLNLSTNSTIMPTFDFMIYNFNSGNWEICDTFNPIANIWYMRWCNLMINPENYLSGDFIRFRLNETPHENLAEVKEDYIQYYIIHMQ